MCPGTGRTIRVMEAPFQMTRRRRRPWINITPLVDVMLLLLIFIMVSSTFRSQQGLDIDLPHAQASESQPLSSHEIVVNAAGQIFFGEHAVDPDQLREALRVLFTEEPGAILVLRGDKAAPYASVVTAMDIAREMGGARLVLPTTPLESAP